MIVPARHYKVTHAYLQYHIHQNTCTVFDQFVRMLEKSLSHIGLSGGCYKSHSFRIGSYCHAMEQGKSETQIRLLGRWHSNAFLRYIIPDHVSL
jgi:hypothetical protein